MDDQVRVNALGGHAERKGWSGHGNSRNNLDKNAMIIPRMCCDVMPNDDVL